MHMPPTNFGDHEGFDIPGSSELDAKKHVERRLDPDGQDLLTNRLELGDSNEELVIDLVDMQGYSHMVAETQQLQQLAIMKKAAGEAGVGIAVHTRIHAGNVENQKHEIAFTTSLVPEQKIKIIHKGIVPTSVQPPAEQTRISIKVHTDKLDTSSTKVLEETVASHKFNIKAKSEDAIMKFIDKCKDSSVITTLAFDPKVCPPGVVFSDEAVARITAALSKAQGEYVEKIKTKRDL